MSESNLTPGEGWQDLGGSKRGAQCFMPKETHVLRYIDLELDALRKGRAVLAKVYVANFDGDPLGAPISESIKPAFSPYGDRKPYRARIQMSPATLDAWTLYVMEVWSTEELYWYGIRWQYQQDLGLYTGGWRLHSGDDGETWSQDWGDDHVFAEFGNPPVFEVPYDPPPSFWALAYFGKNNYSTSSCFRFATTSPVTLTLHITENEPKPIDTYKIVRGVKTRCLSYYAFNEWRYYLQKEKGDSIYHTFHIKKLKEGERYWMVETAESEANPSLSIGPLIFRDHPGGPPFTTIRRPSAPGSLCTIPYESGQPCPRHWENVNEADPDESYTQIWTHTPYRRVWKQDLYHIPPYDMDPRPIAEVQLTLRVRGQYTRKPYAGFQWIIKTHDTIYTYGLFGTLELYYTNKHRHYEFNPYTGDPWTPAEIDDLQIGVGLWHNTGVGWSVYSLCTQVYATIKHKCEAFE